MDQIDMTLMARSHWEKCLPETVKSLKESGEFDHAVNIAVANAQRVIFVLKQLEYEEHVAEEVALSQYILLKPELKKTLRSRSPAAQ